MNNGKLGKARKEHIEQLLAIDPPLPHRTMARILCEQVPHLFKNIEVARLALRARTGNLGVVHRTQLKGAEIMESSLEAMFHKCTEIKLLKDGTVEIRCKQGLWVVCGSDREQVERDARHYWQQYFDDGEYDSLLLHERHRQFKPRPEYKQRGSGIERSAGMSEREQGKSKGGTGTGRMTQ